MKPVFQHLICLFLVLALCFSLSACVMKTKQSNSSGNGTSSNGQSGNTANNKQSGSNYSSDQIGNGSGNNAQTGTSTDDAAVYNGLFDTSRVHTVDVTLSAEDWEDLRIQLNGELAAKTTEQNAADRIDASEVNVSSMSSHGVEQGGFPVGQNSEQNS